jgi:signal transduction histidine kinase
MCSDLTKVRQVLLNLMSNACKFTQKGCIRLVTRRETRDDGDWMIFNVEDNGIGMTDAQLDRIFDAFTQADESTSRRYGGTGLGLTISREFCELLGGEIHVVSEEGKGSTFTVSLPARAPAAS